jgi:hypothetical protein
LLTHLISIVPIKYYSSIAIPADNLIVVILCFSIP